MPPRIHIVKTKDKMSSTHIFPETQFMAVTAYRNKKVMLDTTYNVCNVCTKECMHGFLSVEIAEIDPTMAVLITLNLPDMHELKYLRM